MMDDSLETFVPLAFRRCGVRRVVTDDRYVHDVTLLEGRRAVFLAAPGRHRRDAEWVGYCLGGRIASIGD